MVNIMSVESGSYAEKAGIRAGDTLVSLNGNEVNDVLDYRFYLFETELKMDIVRDGAALEFTIKKPEYDDIGLEFSTYLMDEKKRCRNNCIFCFIDQNPMGMRETVYFKDDDERLSFLIGNYVTLTNLSESDIERIIKMRISPVNISVHTTNPELRVQMMRNRFAGESLRYIRLLDDAGITINAQLVLCRGINDGKELKASLEYLTSLKNIGSIALVPCGLTAHRENLYPLSPYDEASARSVLEICNDYGERCIKSIGFRTVYASDEFYILANLPIPDTEYYEDYPQLENGVGMIRSECDDFCECLENYEDIGYNRVVSIVTGEAAYPFICELAALVAKKFPSVKANVYAVKNNFFGGHVTVSGLVTGVDIIAQLGSADLGDELLIPVNMLRSEEDLFLDGVSVSELESKLGVAVRVVQKGGDSFCDAVLGIS